MLDRQGRLPMAFAASAGRVHYDKAVGDGWVAGPEARLAVLAAAATAVIRVRLFICAGSELFVQRPLQQVQPVLAVFPHFPCHREEVASGGHQLCVALLVVANIRQLHSTISALAVAVAFTFAAGASAGAGAGAVVRAVAHGI